MEPNRGTQPPADLYSLRERIEEHRSHAPSLCTARPGRVSPRSTTLCRLDGRSTKRLRAARLVF